MKKVLYVEDSATSQLLMRKYLEGMCELTITPSLHTAEDLLTERSFDVLITDFLFPGGDAMDLIRHVRKTEATRALPIVVISSSMDGALLSRVLKTGANEGLSKPLVLAEFRAVVSRMFEAPYVHSLEHSVCSVPCFQWITHDAVFQFCPELNLTVSGPTKDAVTRQMVTALQDRLAQGVDLGYTNHEEVVTHVLPGS